MSRDWLSPVWNPGFCSGQGGFVGHEVKESFVKPEYVWFDGTSYVYNIGETIEADGDTFTYNAATIGNPHCVIPLDNISKELACRIGPHIENHPNFPQRINMQLLKVLDRNTIKIEIWERGAGYTLASGSSSSAAAAVAHKLGHVDRDILVKMPGGEIEISIKDDFQVHMTGPATRVATMVLDDNFLKG